AHLALQVGKRERTAVATLTLEVVRDLVAEPGVDVTVRTIDGDVEGAIRKPLGNGRSKTVGPCGGLPRVRGRPRGRPREAGGSLLPERDRVGGSTLPRIRRHVRGLREVRGRRK